MLTEGDTQLDAEEESTGQPSVWRDVYKTMRFPGPHAIRDPLLGGSYRQEALPAQKHTT